MGGRECQGEEDQYQLVADEKSGLDVLGEQEGATKR